MTGVELEILRTLLPPLLRLKGISQRWLAKQAGCHRSTLNKFLRGKIDRLRIETVLLIGTALGISIDEMLGMVPRLRAAVEKSKVSWEELPGETDTSKALFLIKRLQESSILEQTVDTLLVEPRESSVLKTAGGAGRAIPNLPSALIADLFKERGNLLGAVPPAAYLAHPYPLQENFTGRLKELAMLTEWVSADDAAPMLSLVGMGGLGKSALTWFWLHEDLPQEKLPLAGTIWWSFYEREASFQSFLSHALLYASAGTINPQDLPSDYERMQALWCILRESPFLLILDGAERLLRAYHALDAAYKGDDFTEQPGDKHLQCFDPRAGQFLQWLTSRGTKTKTLLTTRLHPKELPGLAGCRREELKRLDPEDALQFMRRQGITGPRTDIVRACEPYNFLPLCLRLLSSAIREDPQKPGDIEAADGWHPPADLVAREYHILHIAYDTMAKDRQDLLSRIAAMRGPVDYDTARVLSTYDAEGDLKEALRELITRGLLFRRQDKPRYDLHPIVRQYAYDRLGDKAAAHNTLKDYFATIPKPDKIQSLEDLLPAIEFFHHTISSGAYEDAFRVYQDRLSEPLYYQLGAYETLISLSHAFFPDGEDHPPRLKDEWDETWTRNSLAIAYYTTGQNQRAVGLLQRNLAIREKQGRKDSIARILSNLARAQILLGELKAAESNLRDAIEMDREVKAVFHESFVHQELARLLGYVARYGESDKQLEKALGMHATDHHEQGQCLDWSYRALRAILMDEPESALKALDKARQFWDLTAKHLYPHERDLVQILWLSGSAKRCLHDLAGAETDLDEALSRCRRIRLVGLEADILLELARLQWQKAAGNNTGLMEQAKSLTREALDIADRCEYRLKQADIHNFLAEVALAENDKPVARKHALTARERAYCDGPPHCYKKALDTAEQMLANLHTK